MSYPNCNETSHSRIIIEIAAYQKRRVAWQDVLAWRHEFCVHPEMAFEDHRIANLALVSFRDLTRAYIEDLPAHFPVHESRVLFLNRVEASAAECGALRMLDRVPFRFWGLARAPAPTP